MVVDRVALREAAKWRSPSVFAIALQIYFQDPARRREETGWTGIRNAGGLVEIFDSQPKDDLNVRDHLYSGGGSSLFRRDLLLRFVDGTDAYAPFYWETSNGAFRPGATASNRCSAPHRRCGMCTRARIRSSFRETRSDACSDEMACAFSAQREFPEVIANCIWHDRAARCCS